MEEKNFTYAHNDTSRGERESATAGLNSPRFDEFTLKIRKSAFEREVPVASDETLNFLCAFAAAKNPQTILEVGCAVGATGVCLLNICKYAHLTAIERDEKFYAEAKDNFAFASLSDRAEIILGDANEVVKTLTGKFDLIFLDCAKVQYIKLLPYLKRLLKKGGALVADDVLLYGWVNGEKPVPPKRRMLVTHIREYLDAVTADEELITSVIPVGDGLAVSVKI